LAPPSSATLHISRPSHPSPARSAAASPRTQSRGRSPATATPRARGVTAIKTMSTRFNFLKFFIYMGQLPKCQAWTQLFFQLQYLQMCLLFLKLIVIRYLYYQDKIKINSISLWSCFIPYFFFNNF
jgi:hypothetical protein